MSDEMTMDALGPIRFPQHPSPDDVRELGEAVLRLLWAQQMLGHSSWTGTCQDYVDPRMATPAGDMLWRIVMASGPDADPIRLALREQLEEWMQGSPIFLGMAQLVAESEAF